MASNQKQESYYWPRVQRFLGGYVSGMALVAVGHPFDTLKVRLQTEGKSGKFKGPIDALVQTVRKEGFFALYKGMASPLFLTGFVNSTMFGLQGLFQHEIKVRKGADPSRPISVAEGAISAVFTGFFLSFLVTPMEVIKSRLQVQYHALKKSTSAAASASSEHLFNGPIDCIKKIIRNEGILGLYRGWLPVVFCRASNYAYFGGYELFRQLFTTGSFSLTEPAAPRKLEFLPAMFAGGFAGFTYWFSCYPVDVIKARLMTQSTTNPQYKGILDCARQIYKGDGIKGFFSGFTPCLIRAFPANAAAFLSFEFAMELLQKL